MRVRRVALFKNNATVKWAGLLDHMHTTLLTILYIFVKESFVLICEGDPQRNLADHV